MKDNENCVWGKNLHNLVSTYKLEMFLEQREVAFLSPSKICENLIFSNIHSENSNFHNFFWVIRTQPMSSLKLFLLYHLNN